jgi:hypothetical protein
MHQTGLIESKKLFILEESESLSCVFWFNIRHAPFKLETDDFHLNCQRTTIQANYNIGGD